MPMLVSGSQQHTEAERQAWLDENEDDVDETIGSTQLDAGDGLDQLVLLRTLTNAHFTVRASWPGTWDSSTVH